LNELKIQYEKEFELKNSLENKANYLLVSSGIIAGLLFSFGATLLEKFSTTPYITHLMILLFIGIILFVAVRFVIVEFVTVKFVEEV